jgi:hypothetical protein
LTDAVINEDNEVKTTLFDEVNLNEANGHVETNSVNIVKIESEKEIEEKQSP